MRFGSIRTLHSRLPSVCSASSGLLFGFFSVLVCAIWTADSRAQFLLPGPLSRAHAELEIGDQCFKCHDEGRTVGDNKCIDCHAEIGEQRRRSKGLHGKVNADRKCGTCHTEHKRRSHSLIPWPDGKRESFDHSVTSWTLKGAHATTNCDKCHDLKSSRGARTYLGLNRECGTCHEDPHLNRLGGDCLSCHTENNWKEVDLEGFDHDLARYKLVGKHEQVACEKCHADPAKYLNMDFRSCTSCHRDETHKGRYGGDCTKCHNQTDWRADMRPGAHPGVSLTGGHAAVPCRKCHDRGMLSPPSKGERCVSCHDRQHKADLGDDCADCHKRVRWFGVADSKRRIVHEKTTYPLEGKHAEVQCQGCHLASLPLKTRYRALKHDRCDSCHEDPHAQPDAPPSTLDCRECHAVRGFKPSTFTLERHEATRFPLEGRHLAVPCSSCHPSTKADPSRHVWRVDRLNCTDCHENPHGANFQEEIARRGCSHCHTVDSWNRPTIEHKEFKLTGMHKKLPCTACHDTSAADRKAGQGPGYRRLPKTCEGCHEDVHLGQFRLSVPTRACDDCHDTNSFEIADFDHLKVTGYPLEGKHGSLECTKCHPQQRLRDGSQTVRYRLGFNECQNCHANPHRSLGEIARTRQDSGPSSKNRGAKQFIRCSLCHIAESWKVSVSGPVSGGFDHGLTGFPLTGRHKTTACTSCHRTDKPLTRQCEGCHRDAHEGRLSSRCDACHTSSGWQRTRAIERHRLTRLPLTGMHALADCSECHRRTDGRQYSGVPSDCYSCHKADYYRSEFHSNHLRDTEAQPLLSVSSRDCARCHQATAWSPAFVDPEVFNSRQALLAPRGHDLKFPISYGPHRQSQCDDCHVSGSSPRMIRCTGCHAHNPLKLRKQHRTVPAPDQSTSCIGCHRGGIAR